MKLVILIFFAVVFFSGTCLSMIFRGDCSVGEIPLGDRAMIGIVKNIVQLKDDKVALDNGYKKFRITILSTGIIKGNFDSKEVFADFYTGIPKNYLSRKKNLFGDLLVAQYSDDFNSLGMKTGDTVLYTPDRARYIKYGITPDDPERFLWRRIRRLIEKEENKLYYWYQDTNSKVGAKFLKALGYKAYDRKTALSFLKAKIASELGKEAVDKFKCTAKGTPMGWIAQAHCDSWWGCPKKDICYRVQGKDGFITRCPLHYMKK